MKLVTGSQMKALDRQAIDDLGIPGPVLMENAGRAVAKALRDNRRLVVLCGKGNNGGDGLVVARALLEHGVRAEVFVLAERDACSADAQLQWRILEGAGSPPTALPDGDALARLAPALDRADVVVDALLGIGIKGAVRGHAAAAIDMLNQAEARRVSVDVPSGLDADSGSVAGACVRADLTVTLGLPKTGLLFHPGAGYVGELVVVPIGYPPALVEGYGSGLTWVDARDVAACLPARPAWGHKGTFGRALVVGGSIGMAGAVVLAGGAALRSGAGLVHLAYPASLDPVVSTRLLEAVKHPLPEVDGALDERAVDPLRALAARMDAVALGPGLGQAPGAQAALRQLVRSLAAPLVVDADGLNALVGHTDALARQAPTVLTPHPGEFARLTGHEIDTIERDRIGVACAFAQRHGVTLLLKGVPTVAAAPDGHVYVNATGNTGLAKGGSGDVLTGMVASLLAQGMAAPEAAACAAWLHGRAADDLRATAGVRGMTPGDVVRALRDVKP